MSNIRPLLALCIYVFILSAVANNISQKPVFVSCLANGHCIYAVLELVVTEHDRVGCFGSSADITVKCTVYRLILPSFLCLYGTWDSAPSAEFVQGVIFMH